MNKLSKNLAYFFIFMMLILVILCALAPYITRYDPIKVSMSEKMLSMSFDHWLGTDVLGRDLFTRVLYGGRTSILLSIIIVMFSLTLGGFIGLVSGYFGGKVDLAITNLTSIFQGLPGMSMMLAISAMLGPGVKSLMIALIFTSWTSFSRIVRGEVLKVKNKPYVMGAKVMGASSSRIIIRYILPNIMPNLIVVFASKVASTMLSIAGLSYIGLGVQPPTPDWGSMINEARVGFRSHPLLMIAPGMAILIVSLGINYSAELFRDYLQRKNRNNHELT